jgi:hypothetical protein
MIIELNKFNDFVEENKKLFEIDVKEYPIDEENFMKWINHHSAPYKEIALDFREKTRHVSFNEFRQTIGRVFADVAKHIIHTQPDKIILYVYPDCVKSNFMVALYFYKLFWANEDFRQKLHIFTDTKDLIDLVTPNDIVIIPDDASYTGGQLSNFLNDISTPSTYFLAVPFMSEKAFHVVKKTIEKLSIGAKTIMSDQTQKFNSFSNDKNVNHEKKYTIYFDHKLPDTISIYQFTYAIGIDSDKGGFENVTNDPDFIFEPMSLIKGCNVPDIKLPVRRSVEDLQTEVGIENMCPSPFYKMITYTYQQKVINDIERIRW